MKPEMILQADVLDIIFDNRNKEYGAYELRSHYERRLKKSILVVFLFLSVGTGVYYWLNNIYHGRIIGKIISLPDTLMLTEVNLHSEEIRPQLPQPQPHQIATIQSTPPLIVPDRLATNTPPAVEQLDIHKIGIETRPGDFGADIVQPVADGNGKNNSSETQPAPEKEIVLKIAEVMPEFPGGQDALMRFLSKNLKMPAGDLEPGSKVSTLVRFVVDKEGNVNGIEFEKSGGKDFDNEVLRVMKKMPQWKPGKQNGKNVAVYFKLPVIFKVPDEN